MKTKTKKTTKKPKPIREPAAVQTVIEALQDLDFDERRRVLRWAGDYYHIAKVGFYQGTGNFTSEDS